MKSVPARNPVITVHDTREAMGAASASRFESWVIEALRSKDRCRVVMGCAPSQDDFFRSLVARAGVNPALWRRVEVFHMDEYVGIQDADPRSFRSYLRRHFLDQVEVAQFYPIPAETMPAQAAAARYAAFLAEGPIDVIAMGIGENGHVAFNDPPVANFSDPLLAKVVDLDTACRRQQVNDGCFPALADVPRQAITITVPVFARAARLCCTVPGVRKAEAVRQALFGPIGPACPASMLRKHHNAAIFLDRGSASLLPPQ